MPSGLAFQVVRFQLWPSARGLHEDAKDAKEEPKAEVDRLSTDSTDSCAPRLRFEPFADLRGLWRGVPHRAVLK